MSAYSFEYNCMVATFYVGEVIMYDANFFVSNNVVVAFTFKTVSNDSSQFKPHQKLSFKTIISLSDTNVLVLRISLFENSFFFEETA